MRKSFILIVACACLAMYAQDKNIDFRTANLKTMNPNQLEEFRHWRDQQFRMLKSTGSQTEIKSIVIQGNKIRTIIYNTGAISNPGVLAHVLDLVWNGLGYGYEFGPLVASRVPLASNPIDSVSIVIDGFGGSSRRTDDGDFAPDGVTKWGWLPKIGYSAPGQNDLASWGARTSDLRIRPKSWPESWYNSAVGEYVFPSFLGGNSTVPDEEVYYVVDDSSDYEFDYYPIASNTSRRGLGINLEVRTFQFSNPLAEDIIFLVYSAENDPKSKSLEKVFFGMFGDPHIGGGVTDWGDDAASFVPARPIGVPAFDDLLTVDGKLTTPLSRNIVYSWDSDFKSEIPTLSPGFFGYKFLESPNNSIDGIDNDDDGIRDESPNNGKGFEINGISVPLSTGIYDTVKYKIVYGNPKPRWSGDEDGDWDKERDDIGVDGIFGTGDEGEGDGFPSQVFFLDMNGNGKYDGGEPKDSIPQEGYTWGGSEPNFGFRDVNESDQIGLRSFWSLVYHGAPSNYPKNDNAMYNFLSAEFDTAALAYLYTTNPENVGDYIFLYGSGPFHLHPGDRQRFSIALLMGSDIKDLLLNSETAQLVLQANYRFAQPPPKPKVVAIPGDGRVTLYWDNAAENTTDPFTGKKDFEGYKIYRSQDYTFKDVFTITDGNGYPFLGKALYDNISRRSAQWHRRWTTNELARYPGGFHPVEYRGRFIRYYMGEPSDTTGLRHEYVDSTVTNGVTYYYAVVSFDHGDDSLQLPPSESQAIVQRDAISQEYKFDVNTAVAVPNSLAKGIKDSKSELQNGMTLTQMKGVSTSTFKFKVFSEMEMKDASYNITFAKALIGSDSVIAYSVLRKTLFVEQIVGNESLYVNLQNRNIVAASLRVFRGADTTSLIQMSSIQIDSANGRLRATTSGVLLKGKQYTVSYQYYPITRSGFYKANDSNPVFDGIRIYAVNDSLMIDQPNSGFQVQAGFNNILHSLSSNYSGLPVKLSPLDVRLTFTQTLGDTVTDPTSALRGDYVAPVDSFRNALQASQFVRVPFKLENATDTTKLNVLIVERSGKFNKARRWDIGEDILVIAPGTANNILFNIRILKSVDTLGSLIPLNAVFNARTRKPFTAKDEYEFSTSAARYDAKDADANLKNVIVVPNPYVISSIFEQPSVRQDLRGDRVIQFRNLPRECTIRIYTITGELVQTLRKNDNTSYVNWDVLSSESARIGYGVYIYHVETPTGGVKIGRLGIIK